MTIKKQITICKSKTDFKIYPESKNEIGLWVAHTPCFVASVDTVEDIVNKALQYSNSGLQATDDTAKNVLKELHIKNWNILYKTYKIISLSLTDKNIIITPYIYTQKGVFPDMKAKSIFDVCNFKNALEQLLK